MATALELALQDSGRVRLVFNSAADAPELAAADRVLLLLSKNVLTPTSLDQLEAVVAQDKAANRDRIRAVYSVDRADGGRWVFGCDEHRGTSAAVKQCLDSHEVLTYRAPDPGGPAEHEFPALVRQLLVSFEGHGLLGRSSSAPGGRLAAATEPEPEPEPRFEAADEQLSDSSGAECHPLLASPDPWTPGPIFRV
jgi:hypothetical protein